MTHRQILRVLDANFNRSREGLRVCEEIARFVIEDPSLTRRLKRTRHTVSDCLKNISVPLSEIIGSRDAVSDVGQAYTRLETTRRDALGLFLANSERVKESLRVLEEVSKLVDQKIAGRLKKTRFHVYSIEKKAFPSLEALRHHGPQRRRRKAVN